MQALNTNLKLSDFELMSIGMIFDYIQEYAELNGLLEEVEYEGNVDDFERIF